MKILKFSGANNIRLCLDGRLDATTSSNLREILEESLTENIRSVIFDFKNLEYISSSGLRVVLYAHKRMISYGEFAIFNANGFVLNVLEVSGFTNMITLDYDIIEDFVVPMYSKNENLLLSQAQEQDQEQISEEDQEPLYLQIASGPMVKISLEDELDEDDESDNNETEDNETDNNETEDDE